MATTFTPQSHPILFDKSKKPDARPHWVWATNVNPPRWAYPGGTAAWERDAHLAKPAPELFGIPVLYLAIGAGLLLLGSRK